MWTITLRKVRSTWHWYTQNPQGGGFGSNHVGSKKVVLNLAMRNIPTGAPVTIVVKHGDTEINRVVGTK